MWRVYVAFVNNVTIGIEQEVGDTLSSAQNRAATGNFLSVAAHGNCVIRSATESVVYQSNNNNNHADTATKL